MTVVFPAKFYLDSLNDDETITSAQFSVPGKTSPLDFLAQASLAANHQHEMLKQYEIIVTTGKERVTVVNGPGGNGVKIHSGNGKLPPIDLNKPFGRKCRNRECNNLAGQIGKPRSIYCSKRCQSREQNLRQGRIKNTKKVEGSEDSDPENSDKGVSLQGSASNTANQDEDSSSPPETVVYQQPQIPHPQPMYKPEPEPPLSASLSASLSGTMTPPPSMRPEKDLLKDTFFGNPLTSFSSVSPSPLTLRLGMTPSPLPMSPTPLNSSTPNIFLPRPIHNPSTSLPRPVPVAASTSSSFSNVLPSIDGWADGNDDLNSSKKFKSSV